MRICLLQWRHNGCDGVSNHQRHDCLLNRLFRRRSNKTLKLRVTGLCAGIHRSPGNSPHKWSVKRKGFSFYNVIMLHFNHDSTLPPPHPCVYVSLSQSISDSYPFRCFVNSVPACGTVISDSPINCVAYMHDVGQWHRRPAWPVLCRVIGKVLCKRCSTHSTDIHW